MEILRSPLIAIRKRILPSETITHEENALTSKLSSAMLKATSDIPHEPLYGLINETRDKLIDENGSKPKQNFASELAHTLKQAKLVNYEKNRDDDPNGVVAEYTDLCDNLALNPSLHRKVKLEILGSFTRRFDEYRSS